MKKTFAVLLASAIIAGGINAFAEVAAVPTEEATEVTQTNEITETVSPEEAVVSTEEPTAEETAEPEPTNKPEETPAVPAQELSDKFVLEADVSPQKYVIPSEAVIELYSTDGTLLGTATEQINQDTSSLHIVFAVPEYRMGESFKVKLVSGLRSLRYYSTLIQPGEEFEVQTYGYLDENGSYVQNNGCSVNANPNYEKEVCMYVGGTFLQDLSPRARIVDGVAMMPVRAIGEAMGLKIKYDGAYDSVVCSVGSDSVIFNANSAATNIFGTDQYISHPTIYIDGSLFVPVRTLAEAFNSTIEALDFGDHMDIVIGESQKVKDFRNSSPVNKNGISSRTNYLVWVSKSEYKVRVYQGSQYNWELLKEYPCALGAWDTPTITGQFEYIEKTEWDYANYYVGPVLRFYNGYALHSTLLYYNGSEYDGRVGVNISHGCVRLHPQDINWIANTIPYYTRIYITE